MENCLETCFQTHCIINLVQSSVHKIVDDYTNVEIKQNYLLFSQIHVKLTTHAEMFTAFTVNQDILSDVLFSETHSAADYYCTHTHTSLRYTHRCSFSLYFLFSSKLTQGCNTLHWFLSQARLQSRCCLVKVRAALQIWVVRFHSERWTQTLISSSRRISNIWNSWF